ncbi:GyrI-like domain-containing protein [uncultured Pseudokineococcus sp.]|uniref:GyrI-like domain-containing protein n=1 Tax=uncultured Pseudokineococcus sp. TaxID=1642928 RepID=UPI002619BDF6|nr:GyrI-like domain-containing protein [uncultured Pseudokineococcus sp.]
MKVDHKRTIPSYRATRGRFDVVEVPPLQYLAVDGSGDPNTAGDYRDAVTSLYPLAYGLKSLSRDELGRDHVVMPLEALWWSDDMATFTTAREKSRWSWTLMIMVPGWLTGEHVERARAAVADRAAPPALERVRLTGLAEGRSVQTLHVGPYDAEGPVLEEMHSVVIPSLGLAMTGRHHEIYLSDPRRVGASRLRTVLRQPVG